MTSFAFTFENWLFIHSRLIQIRQGAIAVFDPEMLKQIYVKEGRTFVDRTVECDTDHLHVYAMIDIAIHYYLYIFYSWWIYIKA